MSERTRDDLEKDIREIEQDISKPTFELQVLALEVLLDIRDVLHRMERDKATKWGSKL